MNRPGFTLVEVAAMLVLGGIICVAVAGSLRSAEGLARSQAGRVAAAEALRIPAVALPGELRPLDPAADIGAFARDSIRIRAFRGAAVVCGGSENAVLVRYRGLRTPDSTKDSVLAVNTGTGEIVLALGGTREEATACAAEIGERVYRWTLESPLPPGTLLLLFESGSYHLEESALRYRRGAGGRQPLTNERLDPALTGFRALDARGMEISDPAALATIEVRLSVETARIRPDRDDSNAFATRLRIPLPNGRAAEDST